MVEPNPPAFNWTAIRFYVDLIQMVAVFVVGIYLYISRSSQLTKAEAEKKILTVTERVQRHSERLSTIEEYVRCAPSHEDLGKLHGRIDDVTGGLKKIEGQLEGVSKVVGLIHLHLLNEKGGK